MQDEVSNSQSDRSTPRNVATRPGKYKCHSGGRWPILIYNDGKKK
jgi:hypothetical protein